MGSPASVITLQHRGGVNGLGCSGERDYNYLGLNNITIVVIVLSKESVSYDVSQE